MFWCIVFVRGLVVVFIVVDKFKGFWVYREDVFKWGKFGF